MAWTRQHGLTRDSEGKRTALYAQWTQMKQRCLNPKHPSYKHYGGRGITVCDRWRVSVEAFADDMGPKPGPEYSVERIRNNEGYSPDNCKWGTRSEQNRNQRDRLRVLHKITVRIRDYTPILKGMGFSNEEIGRLFGVAHSTIGNIVSGKYKDAIEIDCKLYVSEVRKVNHPIRARRTRG